MHLLHGQLPPLIILPLTASRGKLHGLRPVAGDEVPRGDLRKALGLLAGLVIVAALAVILTYGGASSAVSRTRETVEEETVFGKVCKKKASGYGIHRSKYEYEDLAEIARRENISLEEVRRRIQTNA